MKRSSPRACVAVAFLVPELHLHYIVEDPVTFAILAAGVVLGEMLPIKIPRRGDDEELTLSAAFAMAVLLVGGLGPALIAQGAASVLQDATSGKPWWRMRFNFGQYTLSMVAAWLVVRAVSVVAAPRRQPPVRQRPASRHDAGRRRLLLGQRPHRQHGDRALPGRAGRQLLPQQLVLRRDHRRGRPAGGADRPGRRRLHRRDRAAVPGPGGGDVQLGAPERPQRACRPP